MRTIQIEDFDGWRAKARKLIGNQVSPSEVQLFDRDGQQWIFDYIVQETGRVFQWYEPDRQVPASVKG